MDPVDRRRFLRIAGVSLGAGALYRVAAPARGEGGRLMNLLGKSNGEKPTPFSFVQFSDTHVGFSGPPDPLGTKAGIAVLTLSHFPPPPAGETYRG